MTHCPATSADPSAQCLACAALCLLLFAVAWLSLAAQVEGLLTILPLSNTVESVEEVRGRRCTRVGRRNDAQLGGYLTPLSSAPVPGPTQRLNAATDLSPVALWVRTTTRNVLSAMDRTVRAADRVAAHRPGPSAATPAGHAPLARSL